MFRRLLTIGRDHCRLSPGYRHRLRWGVVVFLAAVVLALGAGQLLAAPAWPAYPIEQHKEAWRGTGFYLSWPKMLLAWLLFVIWVATTDWVNRDVQEVRKLSYLRWNPIVFGTFMAAFVLLWILPWFWLGFPLLLLAYLVPLITYVVIRNQNVMIHQRVFTPEHIRHFIATRVNKVGVKMSAEKADPHESGPPVKVFGRGGPTDRDDAVRLGLARQAPGLRDARGLLAAGLKARSSAIMLDFSQQAVAIKHQVDGVWLDCEPLPREQGDPALEAMKILCGLNPQDRVKRQEGKFAAEYAAVRYNATLATQGTSTGERAVIQFEEKKIRYENLESLGMRPKMAEQLRQLLDEPKGLVLVSAMPAAGLRSTTHMVLRSMDRLMRDFAAVEEEGHRYEEVENVPVTTYKAAEGQSPATVLTKLIRTEPAVIVVRDLVNAESLGILSRFILDENRMAVATTRAKDCAEAILRVVAVGKTPDEQAKIAADLAKTLVVVLNQRLVRKLCEKCREAYMPPAEVLQQLGIPPGRAQGFFRPPTPKPDEKHEPCEVCGDVAYFGRTAIFEMLVVGDNVRQALVTAPKLDILRQAARKDGLRTLQDEGVLLVAKGTTSLPELVRVMKQ